MIFGRVGVVQFSSLPLIRGVCCMVLGVPHGLLTSENADEPWGLP